jgi:hypothetical protein
MNEASTGRSSVAGAGARMRGTPIGSILVEVRG